MEKKVALVFSGGGGKGAYEIGVWKALKELGVDKNITGISGTSVGALNAVLFAQGDLDAAASIWRNLSPEDIIELNFESILKRIITSKNVIYGSLLEKLIVNFMKFFSDKGVISKEGLIRIINNHVDYQMITEYPGDIFITAVQIPGLFADYINLKELNTSADLKEALIASASIPVVFGKTYFNGKLYYDGGLRDNTPVRPLYEQGYRQFIVVHLSRMNPLERSLFPDAGFIEIMPKEDMGGIFQGTLNFSGEKADFNIRHGYEDTIAVLKPVYEMGMANRRFIEYFRQITMEEAAFEEKVTLKRKENTVRKQEINNLLNQL